MGISAKHTYRFGFLKSDRWKNLRLARLAMDGAKCRICDKRDISNDVHHIRYRPNWNDTLLMDLRTLCRDCHQEVHRIVDDHPEFSWSQIRFAAFPEGSPKKVKGSERARRFYSKQKSVLVPILARILDIQKKYLLTVRTLLV